MRGGGQAGACGSLVLGWLSCMVTTVSRALSLGAATRTWPHTQCVGGYAVVESASRGQDTGLCGCPTTPLEGRSASLFHLRVTTLRPQRASLSEMTVEMLTAKHALGPRGGGQGLEPREARAVPLSGCPPISSART